MNLAKTIKNYQPVPTIVWGLFIFIMCLLPGSMLPEIGWKAWLGLDKWVHAFLYACWILIYFSGSKEFKFKRIIPVIFFMLLFGAGIELFQEWILTYRSGEFLDWVADGVGLGVGYGIIIINDN